MTPPCCEKCPHLTKDGRCLSNDKLCAKWRRWFHKEWTGIQAAAAIRPIKAEPKEEPKTEPKEEPKEEPKPTPQEEPKPIKRRRSVCMPRTEED